MTKSARRMSGRSGTEECPVCSRKAPLVEHHIHGRDIHGWDRWWNVAWICATCHDEVHTGAVVVEGWVTTTAGKALGWHRRGDEPMYSEGAAPNLYRTGAVPAQ